MNFKKVITFIFILITLNSCGVKNAPVSKNNIQSVESAYRQKYSQQLQKEEDEENNKKKQ